jgi:hypothetical protein
LAGTLNVDTLKADSNLRLQIASANVAFIDANGLTIVGNSLNVGGGRISVTSNSAIINPTITTPTVSGNLSLDSTGTTGVRSPAANTLAFHTSGTEDMRLSSAGNLLLGVTSESGLSAGGDFALKNGAAIRFRNAADSAFLNILNLNASEDLLIGGGGTPANITFAVSGIGEVTRITSGGDLCIGTTSIGSTTSGNNVRFGKGGNGAMASVFQAAVANGGTVDIDVGGGGAGSMCILEASNSSSGNALLANRTIFAVMGRGTSFTFTSIGSQNGTSGGFGFSMSCPSIGRLRLTNTGGSNGDVVLTLFGTAAY